MCWNQRKLNAELSLFHTICNFTKYYLTKRKYLIAILICLQRHMLPKSYDLINNFYIPNFLPLYKCQQYKSSFKVELSTLGTIKGEAKNVYQHWAALIVCVHIKICLLRKKSLKTFLILAVTAFAKRIWLVTFAFII